MTAPTRELERTRNGAKVMERTLEAAAARIKELESQNADLERLCEATYVAQGADAYNYACEVLEQWQDKRRSKNKPTGPTGSLCSAMEWLYEYVAELEKDNRRAAALLEKS